MDDDHNPTAPRRAHADGAEAPATDTQPVPRRAYADLDVVVTGRLIDDSHDLTPYREHDDVAAISGAQTPYADAQRVLDNLSETFQGAPVPVIAQLLRGNFEGNQLRPSEPTIDRWARLISWGIPITDISAPDTPRRPE